MHLYKKILPAIIAQDQLELDQMIKKVPFAKDLMLDLMDGEFVSSESLDFPMSLPNTHNYQLHIMAVNPTEILKEIPQEVDTVILHLETLNDISMAINYAKTKKLDVFIALNPDTPITIIEPYIENINGVLIMTVKPGKYGAKFLPDQLLKVRKLREISKEINIEVDGGMSDKTIGFAIAAGANMIASGSFIMKSSNPKAAYNLLKKFL